ncbi:hypothetical protein JXR93_08130 [bacterium]|nr:hypothetical protein [bacterium]
MKIFVFIFFILLSNMVFAVSSDEFCEYRFFADGNYDGSLSMKPLNITETGYTLEVDFKMGSIHQTKTFEMPLQINKEEFVEKMIEITSSYNKSSIKILSKKIINNYTYEYKDRKYKGTKIDVDVEIDGNPYTLTYTLYDKVPLLNILRFSIIQKIKTKKEYTLENMILIQTYKTEGTLYKL